MFARLLCAAALCVPAMWASSAVQIVPDPNNTFNNGIGFSLGYEITVNTTITVDALGYFADPDLTESHDVGIFNASGALLTSATVTEADPLSNLFRYAAITPITLTPGTYQVMGTSGFTDPYAFNPLSFSTDSRITWVQSEYTVGNTLAFGTNTDSNIGYFGPNFDIGTGVVPEPASLFLFSVGLAGFGVLRLRKRA